MDSLRRGREITAIIKYRCRSFRYFEDNPINKYVNENIRRSIGENILRQVREGIRRKL